MSVHKDQSVPRTQTRGLRARAWWVLRKNRSVTLKDLLLTLCDGSEKEAEGNLRRWLNALCGVGILTRKRVPDHVLTSNGVYRYSLASDIGPKAPVVRAKFGTVFNPNNGQALSSPHSEQAP